MKISWLFIAMLSAGLMAGCGGSSNDDDDPVVTDDNGGGGSIEVLTVSGDLFTLTGKSFTTDCYLINGGTGPDKNETTTFTATQMERESVTYSTSDGSCSGSVASTTTFTTDWDEQGTVAIVGWVDGGDNPTAAPQAEDGSGALADDESVTLAEIEVLTSSSGDPSVGFIGDLFFVVDDTDLDAGGCVVLWRNHDSDEVSTSDPFKNSSC